MTTGLVFDIQRFAIHDGPGIRTLVFLKGCPLRCLWCCNPESQSPCPEIASFESNCIGCGNCFKVCPLNAIYVDGGVYRIDRRICNNCGKCAQVCCANSKKLIGKWMSVDDVLSEVRKDVLFYRNSGGEAAWGGGSGGVTLSGGEPLMQPAFVVELLKRCRQLGIHTVMETSGYAEYEILRNISEHLDLLYFDIKHMDPVKHLELIGVSNEIILSNAEKVVKVMTERSNHMIIRVPVISGYNDSEENIERTAQFVATLKGVVGIELLPYHRLGAHKYKQLGHVYRLEGLLAPSDERLQKLKCISETRGLRVQVAL